MKSAILFCSLSLLLAPMGAIAQEAPSQVGAVNAAPGDMTGQEFAQAVMASDMFEIQSGRLAANQAVSPDVRQFGQQMVDDHSQTTAQLRAVLGHILTGQYVTPPPKLDPRHMDMYSALQAAHGEAFDHLYVRQQLGAHREAIAVLKGYVANGREAALRRFAAETLPIVRHHLQMLRQIRGGGESSARAEMH